MKRSRVLLVVAIFASAWLYEITGASFPNDQFDHLSKARQVLHGEYPIRDFFDTGRPLTIGMSAAALSLSGDTLFGEALLTTSALAIGVALVFGLTWQLSGSILWALWAAGCTMAIEPRLYNYPKVFVCMVGLLVVVRYLDAPSPARAAALGAWGAIGFLFRHDLGVYLAATTAVALLSRLLHETRSAVRDAVIAGAVAVALAAPYVVYLQRTGALNTVAEGGSSVMLDAAAVTWRAFAGPGTGATWLRHNAENWLYYLFLFTPLIGVIARFSGRVPSASARHLIPLATLCAMLVLFLIRGNLDSRLPDVAAPSFVLAAWMLATVFVSTRGARPWHPARLAALTLAAVTALSVLQISEWRPARHVAATLIGFPRSVSEPIARLRIDPLEAWERDGTTDVRGLGRWMRQCTRPDDRVLVFGYHPEVFFYARRLFAGGMLFFHAAYFSSVAEQHQSIAWLERQTVPFVVVEEDMKPALDGTYDIVGAYVRQHYSLAVETTFDGPRVFSIFSLNGSTPRVTTAGLPCLL